MGIVRDKGAADEGGATATADPSEDGAATEAPRFTEPTGNELEELPTLLEGTRVEVTAGDYKGRMAAIERLEFDDDGELSKWYSAFHPLRRFAKPSAYIVRTRDAQNITISVKPDQVKPLDQIEGWARGQVT